MRTLRDYISKLTARRYFFLIVLLLITGSVYLYTMPPSILWIDSGTMIAASKTLGIPNPPGFPFYMLVSHIFSIIPIFNVLTRLELFTIMFSLFLLILVYNVIELVLTTYICDTTEKKHTMIIASSAFFACMSLAFSYQYWSQSENTEGFIFTYFFVSLFLFVLLKLLKQTLPILLKKDLLMQKEKIIFRYFLGIAIMYGLASGANPTIACFIPTVLYALYLHRQVFTSKKILILGIVFFSCVALVYSYLPIRAHSYPFVNWGNPQTLTLFIGQLHGAGLNIYEPETNTINGFTGSPVIFIQSISYYFFLALLQFTPLLVPGIIMGMITLWKKNKHIFLLLLLAPITETIYAGLYYSGNQESWAIPIWIHLSIFLGIGFYAFYRMITNPLYKKALLLLCITPFLVWFMFLNRHSHAFSKDYAINMYRNVDKNAIILGTGDFFNSLTYYLHEADIYRHDVTPITTNTFYVNKWYRDDIRHASPVIVSQKVEDAIQYKRYDEYNKEMNIVIADNITKHPIYITPLALRSSALAGPRAGVLEVDSRFKLIPHGLLMQVVTASSAAQPDPANYSFTFSTPITNAPVYLERNYIGAFANILDDYSYAYEGLADWLVTQKNTPEAKIYYKKALDINDKNGEILSHVAQFFAQNNDANAAVNLFKKSVIILPSNPTSHYNYGLSLNATHQIKPAIDEMKAVEQLVPKNDPIYADAEQQLKNFEKESSNQNSPQDQSFSPAPETADWQTVTDQENNFSMKIAPNYVFQQGAISQISNGSLVISAHMVAVKQGDNLLDDLKSSPLQPEGTQLDIKESPVPGYNAFVQLYANTTQQITMEYVLQRGNFAWQFLVSPGDSPQIKDVTTMLTTLQPYHHE